jgi:hypothetical protein
MDRKQFAIYASALRTYFPKENILPNDQAMALWFKQLQDIPYDVAEIALNKWVAVNKWSPSISEIRQTAIELMSGESKDWGDAWEEVLKAINYYGSYREEDALNSLDDTTRKVVKRLGFRNICMSENIEADRANFRMIYTNQMERDKQAAQLPESLKQLMGGVTKKIEG